MDLKKYLGVQVRSARLRAGMNQEQLSERIDKAVETISNIERGNTYTGLETLEKIAEVFGVPLRDFFEAPEDARGLSEHHVALLNEMTALVGSLSEESLEIAVEQVRALAKRTSN